jgi:hypothetical protein
MRALLKMLLLFAVSATVARVTGQLVSRRYDEGSEASDEFKRMVFMDGTEFTSRAGGLRRGAMRVVLGGAKLDLREATLDPAGAAIAIESTMSGVAVVVRDDWAVTVDHELVGGGETQIDVTPPDDLPDDAPTLYLSLLTRLGSSVVSTGARKL